MTELAETQQNLLSGIFKNINLFINNSQNLPFAGAFPLACSLQNHNFVKEKVEADALLQQLHLLYAV
ncbi:hypothetical protein FVR03_05675 [Pontibacter qinzhouensis]|uniref:Uncharacterized protein n=1 Tax=Pontibacter qinzhouensis TaxID=2603253 RepID=A0A5C8K8K5_9BACT|nr:hypothetical protein [Pontibacter qinzhouensis]TXK49811.1 hypothetical protein FVR03_05675 [Pontibacter qinzhouensis]